MWLLELEVCPFVYLSSYRSHSVENVFFGMFSDTGVGVRVRVVIFSYINCCLLYPVMTSVSEKMLPAISVNKWCCSHQAITLQLPRRWALRELRMETGCPPSSSQLLQPPWWCTLRRLRMKKHRILSPESWGAHQRNDFSEPRLLHLPIRRKALNSLTCDVWFSLINGNLLMFRLPGLCSKNSCVSWFPTCLFWAVPQNDLRGHVPGLSPQFCPRNKT